MSAPFNGRDVVDVTWLPDPAPRKKAPVDTAALRDFANVYEERTRRLAQQAEMPLGDAQPVEPVAMVRAAADELDQLRQEITGLRKALRAQRKASGQQDDADRQTEAQL